MSSSIYRINIIRAPIIFAVKELMEETFFSFMRFDAVITEMLDITVFSIGMIPFEDVPVRMSYLCRDCNRRELNLQRVLALL